MNFEAVRKLAATTLLEIKNDPINETINLSDNAIKEGSGTIKLISGTIKLISGTIKLISGTIKPISGTIKPGSGMIKPGSGMIKPISGTIKPGSGTIKPISGTIKQSSDPINHPSKSPVPQGTGLTSPYRTLTQIMPRWRPKRPRPPAFASSLALYRVCTLPRKQTACPRATL